MFPDFVIIGAQKSASTFLHMCLSEHPDVYLPNDEIPFFESPDYENQDIKALETMFEGREERCLGIKRPNYLGKPEVPARIACDLPNAKLIAVLRNPVDRAVSAYFHYMNQGFIPLREVNFGIQALIAGKYNVRFPRAHEIIEFGFYCQQLNRYRYFLDRSQILILLHDDVLADKLAAIQRTYSFLDISASYVPPSIHIKARPGIYNIRRANISRLATRIQARYSPDGMRLHLHRNTVRRVIGKSLQLLDEYLLARLFAQREDQLHPETARILLEIYLEDIMCLEKLIGRDLSNWKISDDKSIGYPR